MSRPRWAAIGWSSPSIRHIIWRVRATETGAECSAISLASAMAAGSRSSAGCTERTSPPSSASLAGNSRPVQDHSTALLIPTTRGRNHDEHASGTMPRRANTKPNRACSPASRTSIGRVMVAPTPTAAPLIAPITGLRESKMRNVSIPPPSRGTPDEPTTSLPPRANVSPPRPRSAPAQNARPAPVTTTARTSSSASVRSNAAIISLIIVAVNALRRSGRSRVSVATPPSTSSRICEKSSVTAGPYRGLLTPGRPTATSRTAGSSCRSRRRDRAGATRRSRGPT